MSAMLSFAFGQTTIPVGLLPTSAAVNPVTNKIYIANKASDNVTVIDGATNSTSTVVAGSTPISIAVNPVTNKIYVANSVSNNVTVIDGATNSTSTVVAGSTPTSIAVNPVTNKVYVANRSTNNVTVIDGTDNSTATVAAGGFPLSVAVNPVTNKIYVANSINNNVTVIDGTNNSTSTVAVGGYPISVAVNPVTNKIYTANSGSDNVTVIDGTNHSTSTVAVGGAPCVVALNPVTNKIYVANRSTDEVTVIDGATKSTSSVLVGTDPQSVAVNPVTNKVYVANTVGDNMTVIDGATNSTSTVAAGDNPTWVAVNPVTNKIYVANQFSFNVTVIDGAINSTTAVGVGTTPYSMEVNSLTNKIYVANTDSASVTVIDGNTNSTATVATGAGPDSVAVNPLTNKIYVANTLGANVTVIDGATNSTSTIAAGTNPASVAVNPVTNKIYVANYNSGNVTVIDGTNNSTSAVAAGTRPHSVAVNPATNKIYVANYSSSNVTVIDGTDNSTSTVVAGTNPNSVAVNPATNKIYVANYNSGNVTVIDGTNNSTTVVAAGTNPYSVAVNPVTNKIYVANYNSGNVTVIDGTNNSTSTVAAGFGPSWVAVNPVTNKIYVANYSSSNVTVIDGTSSSTTTVVAGSGPSAGAVNPVTNRIYVANQKNNNVTVITEQQVVPIPLTTNISPLAGNQTANPTPTFTFAASSAFSPTATRPDRVFYQADTWQGAWSETGAGNGSYSGKLAALAPGFHILYAYAGDSQEATSTQTSPLTGAIQAYGFLVQPAPILLPQTITFNSIANLSYGIDPFQLAATASSNLPVAYTGGVANVCSVTSAGLVTILGVGQCSLTANQAGDAVYAAAASVTETFRVNALPGPLFSVTKTHTGSFVPGQTGVKYTITVSSSANGSATSGDVNTGQVAVVDAGSPGNLTNLTLTGSGWTCSQNGCFRSDVLQPGSAYPPITATANVAANASNFTNVAKVYYGASSAAAATASDPTTIAGGQLGVGVTHGLGFTQGQTNAHYSVSITNLGSSAVAGIVVTENLPTGLTLASIPSPSWNCNGNVCSLPAPLQPGSTIPLDVYVNVAANAPASVTNQVAVTATGLAQPIVNNDVTAIAPAGNTNRTLVPASGSGSTQAFTFTFPSPGGYQNLAGAQIVINSALTAVNSCYVLFTRPDVISLATDSGNSFQSTSLGAPAVLQNSQCVVLASLTSQSGSGNTVTLTLDVVFKATFAGPKLIWANYNTNAGVAAGYQQLGTYTATAPQAGFTSSVSPASGSGQAQSFTFSYFDANGAPDISGAGIAFNSTLSGAHACYILVAANNLVSLATDDASTFNSAVLGQRTVLQNSQCTVYPGLSYQTQSGQTLNFTVFVSFNPSFNGVKNIYSNVNNNAGTSSGFITLGTWTVTGTPPVSVNSVNPSSASGPSQPLTFVYADPAGASDITAAQVVINPTPTLANSCVITISPAAGTISLATDTVPSKVSASLGQAIALQNNQCIVNAAASWLLKSGNYLTVTLFVTMKTGGSQNIYTSVASTGGVTNLAQFATWNVTSPTAMTPVSVTPLSGAGAAGSTQFLTFTLSDPVGAADISGSLIVLYPSLQGVGSCYILWGHGSNLLSLASDNALSFASGAMGSQGLLSNSQCSVDPSQSFAVQTGNTVNLTVAVSFKAIYRQFQQIYAWVDLQNEAGTLSGWFFENRFTVQ